MSSLELTGPRCGTWAGLGGVVSTTACDPALVGKVALCSFAASAEVESPADLLDCIVGGSFWVVGTPCWGDAGRRSGACWWGCGPVAEHERAGV